ncbi:hypothetical protein [Aurantiacibacter sp. D1-12]|uniref:hypothetical protein n=1 Tax=Aurantiacibacter sp. D1-12 TaxID=2993658 RepID=UPI00237CDC9A|nr:hypothetical protein [Aurantiacibacter sp. D1-12]MDE1468085.1 hypothetical protein [Aurantiacibacter sp. D1-12]
MKDHSIGKNPAFAWAMLAVSIYFAWQAVSAFSAEDGSLLGISLGGAVVFFLLAARKFWELRRNND